MIITRLSGGMGNQMFQYALGRVLSIKYNVSLKLDTAHLLDRTVRPIQKNYVFRDYSLNVFNISASIADQFEIPWKYRFLGSGIIQMFFNKIKQIFIKNPGKEKSFVFDSTILNIGKDVYLNGYWQSPKYFTGFEDVIRKDFVLQDSLPELIMELAQETHSCESLCIHYRRGDFVGNKFHDIVDNAYYTRAMDLFKNYPIDRIYVFSDDISWCREHVKFSFPTIFVGNEYSGDCGVGHFYLMQQCKYFIIPNSSFAWWAAWLANRPGKKVIAPQQWFPDKHIDTTDLIPQEWIRI